MAPIISCRKRGGRFKKSALGIIANCEQIGLSKTSLILICTLSCLYERNDGADPLIGRNIIKPCESYSNEDAHNAISDLRALEMLAAINGLNIGCVSFCTRDKYLAAMWCGLKVSSPKWSSNQFTMQHQSRCFAFPRLTKSDVSDLVGELKNA